MNEKENLLNNIDIIDFTMTDLALYLDTHPYDRKAMEFFSHYAKVKKQLCNDFSRKYYPLSMEESDGNSEWRWGLAPLPWEGGCK